MKTTQRVSEDGVFIMPPIEGVGGPVCGRCMRTGRMKFLTNAKNLNGLVFVVGVCECGQSNLLVAEVVDGSL